MPKLSRKMLKHSISINMHKQLEGWGRGDNKLLFSIIVPPSLYHPSPVTKQISYPTMRITRHMLSIQKDLDVQEVEGWGQGDNKLSLVSSSHHPSTTCNTYVLSQTGILSTVKASQQNRATPDQNDLYTWENTRDTAIYANKFPSLKHKPA